MTLFRPLSPVFVVILEMRLGLCPAVVPPCVGCSCRSEAGAGKGVSGFQLASHFAACPLDRLSGFAHDAARDVFFDFARQLDLRPSKEVRGLFAADDGARPDLLFPSLGHLARGSRGPGSPAAQGVRLVADVEITSPICHSHLMLGRALHLWLPPGPRRAINAESMTHACSRRAESFSAWA